MRQWLALPQGVRRVAWFVALWLASIAALGIVAYGIRFWLGL